jgi:hypothetical protein
MQQSDATSGARKAPPRGESCQSARLGPISLESQPRSQENRLSWNERKAPWGSKWEISD